MKISIIMLGVLLCWSVEALAEEMCRVHRRADESVIVTCPAQTPSLYAGLPFIDVPKSTYLGWDRSKRNAWRYANGQVSVDESVVLSPDIAGFKAALRSGLGKNKMRAIMRTYPEALPALDANNWPWLQQAVIDAKAAADLTQTQYDAIKAAATTYHIPVTLP